MSFLSVAAIFSVVNEFSCKFDVYFFFALACFMLNFWWMWQPVPLHKCQRLSFHDIFRQTKNLERAERMAQREKKKSMYLFYQTPLEMSQSVQRPEKTLLSSMKRFSPFFSLSSRIKCYKYCFMSRKESKSEMTKREREKSISKFQETVWKKREEKETKKGTHSKYSEYSHIKNWMWNCANISL